MNPPGSHLPEQDGSAEQKDPYPLGFKVAVGLTALYLLYRFAQGLAWLFSQVAT